MQFLALTSRLDKGVAPMAGRPGSSVKALEASNGSLSRVLALRVFDSGDVVSLLVQGEPSRL